MTCWVAAQLSRPDLSGSWQRNARNSGKHLCERMGDVQLDRLGLAAMERYRDRRIREGWATATIKQHLKMLRAAWAWGGQMGVCPDRALPRAPVKVKAMRAKYTPTRDEMLRVLDELDGWPRLVGILLFATGARIGAVSRLRWADLDLERGLVTFDDKNGVRTVPLAGDVLSELRLMSPGDPGDGIYGVTWKGARARFGSKYLKNACKRAKTPHFSPHGFRRAAVDALMRAGVDPGTAAAYLRHSPQVMLEYYRQASMADQRRALAMSGLGSLGSATVIPFPAASETQLEQEA